SCGNPKRANRTSTISCGLGSAFVVAAQVGREARPPGRGEIAVAVGDGRADRRRLAPGCVAEAAADEEALPRRRLHLDRAEAVAKLAGAGAMADHDRFGVEVRLQLEERVAAAGRVRRRRDAQ